MDENLLRAALQPSPDCPPLEVLSAHLSGAEGTEARAIAERHLSECLHCRTEMDLLREFETGDIRPEESASVKWITERLDRRNQSPAQDRKTRWWTAWRIPKFALGLAGFALAILFAVGISSEWRQRERVAQPLPEFRNEAQRSQQIEIVEHPGYFDWKTVPGAVRYDLTVRTVDGAIIFHNFFTGTVLAFPPQVASLVKIGKLLVWEVVALDAAGTEIARSGLQRLREAPSSSH